MPKQSIIEKDAQAVIDMKALEIVDSILTGFINTTIKERNAGRSLKGRTFMIGRPYPGDQVFKEIFQIFDQVYSEAAAFDVKPEFVGTKPYIAVYAEFKEDEFTEFRHEQRSGGDTVN